MIRNLSFVLFFIFSFVSKAQITLVGDNRCQEAMNPTAENWIKTAGYHFVPTNNYLYYHNGCGLYTTDGNSPGSFVSSENIASEWDYGITHIEIGDILYYGAGNGFYKRNTLTGGPSETIKEGLGESIIPLMHLTRLNNLFFFIVYGSTATTTVLWRSDGTEAGTYPLKQEIGSGHRGITSDGAYVYFISGQQDEFGNSYNGGLWRSDGTLEGTQPMYVHRGNSEISGVNYSIFDFFHWKGSVYALLGADTYINDPNPNGINESNGYSQLLKLSNGIGTLIDSHHISHFRTGQHETNFTVEGRYTDGYLYPTESGIYVLNNLISSSTHLPYSTIWKCDGVSVWLVKTLAVGSSGIDLPRIPNSRLYSNFTNVLYFTARTNAGSSYDYELWRTDGTDAGTFLLKDIYPGEYSSNASGLIEINGICYFHAEHPNYGREIWKTNGTSEGTVLVQDLNPGSVDGVYGGYHVNAHRFVAAYDGQYYFMGTNPDNRLNLFTVGNGEELVSLHIDFGEDDLGSCTNCNERIYQKGQQNNKNFYTHYTLGQETFLTASKFTLGWNNASWEAYNETKSPATNGNWIKNEEYAINGLNTSPLPPCSGWSKDIYLHNPFSYSTSTSCTTPQVTYNGIFTFSGEHGGNTTTTGFSNGKNSFRIGSGLLIRWNQELSRWETILDFEGWEYYSDTQIYSTNASDYGSLPPCEGWTNGQSLAGDICYSFPDGIPDYIYRPQSPLTETLDKARKAIFLNPGTVIDALQIRVYEGKIKQ